MNVLELIEILKEKQKHYEENEKEYYSNENDCDYKSPEVRLLIGWDEGENRWLQNVALNCGSGYEVHPEVCLYDNSDGYFRLVKEESK